MNWKYYILHEWPEGEMQTWEDVFILPDVPSYSGDALWITIDCAVPAPDENSDDEWRERYKIEQRVLGGARYNILDEPNDLGSNMILSQHSFSINEFLNYVKIWIASRQLPVTDLISAPIEEFAGRCAHADLIISLQNSNG